MQPISAARRVTLRGNRSSVATVRPRARRLGKRSKQVVTRVHEAAAARGRRSDSNMNRLRRSDVCLRTSQHTDVLRYLLGEKPTLHTLEENN